MTDTFNKYVLGSKLLITYSLERLGRKSNGKRGCGFFGQFCPNNLEYGYKATASGNCRFLAITSTCLSTNYCLIPQGLSTNSLTFLQPDSYRFTEYTYEVGECLSNNLGDASTECVNLYGSVGKTRCDTNTNMCTAGHGTCAFPRNLGSLNNYGNELKEKTFTISQQTQDDIFKFTLSKKGRVIASLTSTAGIGIDGILGPVFTADYCSALFIDKPKTTEVGA